jgi:hypothetical protein
MKSFGGLNFSGRSDGMLPFVARFPELGSMETRTISLIEPTEGAEPGEYAFSERYCVNKKCDCRRVVIQVIPAAAPDRVLAVINFGWESEAFYTRCLHGDAKAAQEIRAATLDPLNRQSGYAEMFLRLFRMLLVPDRAYVERLARHYKMFKDSLGKANFVAR